MVNSLFTYMLPHHRLKWRRVLKVKGHLAGSSTLKLLSLLYPTPWSSSLIHLQRRHRTKRHESPLLAKEGTVFVEGISLSAHNTPRLIGSFTCRKVGTWDRLFNFPSEGRRAEDFFTQKKSNGFGRVRTCKLGNQRPARKPLDHRSCPMCVTDNFNI
jgi:hypothetical protein